MGSRRTKRVRGAGLTAPNRNGDQFAKPVFISGSRQSIRGVRGDVVIVDETVHLPPPTNGRVREQDGELYLSNENGYLLDFFVKESIGMAIGNTAAIARTEFK